jgi:uncharacterized membrane protein
MMLSSADILQASTTVLVGLLIFLTLGYRFNLIEWTFIRPKSANETKSQLKRRINGGGLLLLGVFISLAISVISSLFDRTFDLAKGSFILAVILLIIRITLHDRYSPKNK